MSTITRGHDRPGVCYRPAIFAVYFGLPIAMVILSVTVLHAPRSTPHTLSNVASTSAYGHQFPVLIGRAFWVYCRASRRHSTILNWSIPVTVLVCLRFPWCSATSFGECRPSRGTDVKQMVVVGCMSAAVGVLGWASRATSVCQAINLAGATGRLQVAVDTRFSLSGNPRCGRGCLADCSLSLSHFGCDQSQVQRHHRKID